MSKRRHLALVPNDQEAFFDSPRRPAAQNSRGGRPKHAERGAERPRRGEAAPVQRGGESPSGDRYVKNVVPKSEGQARLLEAVDTSDMVLALGPAGSGKTYLAVARAVQLLQAGKVDRIVLARPAVEAGERLGFLPGGLKDKLDPYMRPLYDALQERMSAKQVSALIELGVIEIAPIAFMRGRTLARCAIVVDEAQNATRGQLAMVMTRLGFGSTMILTGDPDQIDLLPGDSGLEAMAAELEATGLDRVTVVRLGEADVVRHPTVRSLLPVIARVTAAPLAAAAAAKAARAA